MTGVLPRGVLAQEAKPFRVVHMTDMHAQPEMNAPWGFGKALRHAAGLSPRADLLVTGGDLIMDSFAAREDRTRRQWEVFTSALKENWDRPVVHTLGNHDVWGWNKQASRTTGEEPLWGKRWFCDLFGYERTYQSLDAGGWRILVLDTVLQTPDGYNGFIDEEQFDWMKSTIEGTPKDTPVMVVSHIPLIAPCTMLWGYNAAQGEWVVGGNLQTKNFDDVKKVFDKNPQVKLCVSGHIHLVDRYEYNGVAYLCNGAVSGAWWLGRNREFPPGYVVLDLYPDGRWTHEFVEWGWNPAGKDV